MISLDNASFDVAFWSSLLINIYWWKCFCFSFRSPSHGRKASRFSNVAIEFPVNTFLLEFNDIESRLRKACIIDLKTIFKRHGSINQKTIIRQDFFGLTESPKTKQININWCWHCLSGSMRIKAVGGGPWKLTKCCLPMAALLPKRYSREKVRFAEIWNERLEFIMLSSTLSGAGKVREKKQWIR